MTKTELARLAAAINLLRPDWPTRSLETFLTEHFTGRPLRDSAVALAWIATDGSATPGRVLQPGPWWQAASTRDAPVIRNACSQHPLAALRVDPASGEQLCAGCYADRQAADRPLPLRNRGVPPTPNVRAQLVAAMHVTPSVPPAASDTEDVATSSRSTEDVSP